jgi:hypothetical protein
MSYCAALFLHLCVIHGGHSTLSETDNITPKRLMIYTRPRSGSTYLDALLASHRNLFSANELFNPNKLERLQEKLKITFNASIHDYPTLALAEIWKGRGGGNNMASSM